MQDLGISEAGDGRWRAVVWEPIPEPSSIFALLTGLCGVAGLVVRKTNWSTRVEEGRIQTGPPR